MSHLRVLVAFIAIDSKIFIIENCNCTPLRADVLQQLRGPAARRGPCRSAQARWGGEGGRAEQEKEERNGVRNAEPQ
eukprot:755982-Rhodomonas_salina.2